MKKILLCFMAVALCACMAMAQTEDMPHKHHCKSLSRAYAAFLMGWDGLGGSPFSGMQSAGDKAYSTLPWFNSWQLEVGYKFLYTKQWKAFVAVGYESDVYKMEGDFVYLDVNQEGRASLYVADRVSLQSWDLPPKGWESRLCARYVTLPIGVSYSLNSDFGVGLTLVPGLSFSTGHTGLKYKYNGDNQPLMREPLSGHIQPLKCDIRANVSFHSLNLFLQISTVPLFKDLDGDDVYPMRLGFMLKL